MSKLLQSLVFGFSILATTTVCAGQSGHYRWTDENGTVKYADHPPEGIKAEFIKFASTKHSKSTTTTADQDATAEKPAAGPTEMEVLPEKDPKLCKQAQTNLKALEGARIRITEADGSKRFITEEEKEQQRENARKFIKIHC